MRLVLMVAAVLAVSTVAHAQSDPAAANRMQVMRDLMDSHMQHLSDLHDAQARSFKDLRSAYEAWREKDIQLQDALEKGDSEQDSDSQQSVRSEWAAESAVLQAKLQTSESYLKQWQSINHDMFNTLRSGARTRAETAKSRLTPAQQERVDKMMDHAKEVFGSLSRHHAEELRRKFHEIARHRDG